MVDVFFDEKFIGTVENARDFVKKIRESRREGKLLESVNISYDSNFNEVLIETSPGRARRPLIVVKDGKSTLVQELLDDLVKGKISWDNLVEKGVIEYLDANEEENAFISLYEEDLTKKHTHLEITPFVILSVSTSLVPYSNFCQAPRTLIGVKSQKQGIGLYASNFLIRMDTDVGILHYPQKPLVNTFMDSVFQTENNPFGQNVTIAVMSYEGYNMEDSIIFNKGSIDRGLARSTYFRPYSSEELRYSGGLMDEIGIPDKEVKGYRSEKDYRLLEKDGIVYTGAKVNEEDIIIGKTSPPRFLGDLEEFSIAANIRRESSTNVKQGESGIVDLTIITENEEGNKLVRIRLRDERIPELGDKFASRYGQKGVIGMVVPNENMPFSESGIIPDMIFSPHSIPSRMTVAHLLEILAGKVGALKGEYVDGTTFDAVPEEKLRKELMQLGFRDDGTEIFYNGLTGEKFKARIFVGNMYYFKLKYLAANKLHARASGRVQLLTRQPIEGRAEGGGLRLGEMERDCLVAHGASLLLKERFDSDKTIFHICEECGMVAVYDSFRNKMHCPKCGGTINISTVEMSYAFKLLLDELKSLGIYPKLELKGKY